MRQQRQKTSTRDPIVGRGVVAAHLVAQGATQLDGRGERFDEIETRFDLRRGEERLAEPAAHEPAAHQRLALRDDAEQRRLGRLAGHRLEREGAHRARVEAHAMCGVDPLERPLAVGLRLRHEAEVRD